MDPPYLQDEQAEVHRAVVGRLDTNVWILRCRHTGEAVLVDAAGDAERLLDLAEALGVGAVLQTHGHWDHVGALPAFCAAGYRVRMHAADADMVARTGHVDLDLDLDLDGGTLIAVGALILRALATPGHTPGSMCFQLESSRLVFAGDTLFAGGPGATGGDPTRFATILDGIEHHLLCLPDETLVLPGHGPHTTVGAERPHLGEWVERGW